jgi:hypothetical protein
MDFSGALPAASGSVAPPQMPAQASAPAKSKKWLFIILGLLVAGGFVLILLAAVFGWFFYNSKQ